ncbi:hypothetical protein KK062_05985 [Fulvivirgaceae bacterium PWU5]|jgi:hypothetical protein|uniref:Uncharacterized protein n=1 Tax=Dawidia cretensis TaxID=2782350 RepID=A0AAP2GNZ5_9BACT|nr:MULTISPECIES: hypothetical protein [Cytophagales]MBT1707759.1 hypothetical protein [Dawidia cretensis]MCD9014694.1 hypothetical protein [Parachryseolinea silvisoli]
MAKKIAPQKEEPKKPTPKKVTDISGHPAKSPDNEPQLYESNYKKTKR